MQPRHFISQLDHDKVVAAINAAEKRTSGEIRVYVSHRKIDDALGAGKRRFEKLGMHKTRHRNAVLVYIAPKTHRFAVIGDKSVHEKCGELFWDEITSAMQAHLKSGSITNAVVGAIEKIGDLLARHFPGESGEMPDSVVEGE